MLKCQQVTQDLQQEDQKQPSKLISIKKTTTISSFGISLHIYLYKIYIYFMLKLAFMSIKHLYKQLNGYNLLTSLSICGNTKVI